MTDLRETAQPTIPGPSTAATTSSHLGRTAAAAGLAVVLWASAFVAIRDIGHTLSPAPLALLRLGVAAATLTVLAVARRTVRVRVSRRAFALIAAYAVLWLAGYTVALNAGEQHVDAGTAALLVNVAPLLVAVAAGKFLGEPFSRALVVGSLVALGGTALIAAGAGTHRDWAGVLLCLLAAVLYAAGVMVQKATLRHVDGFTAIWLGCVVATVALLPWAPQLVGEVRSASAGAITGAVYLGAFPTAIGFTAWAYALRRMDAGRLSAVSYAVPAVSVLMSWLLLAEIPTAYGLVGGALCLAGVAISRRLPAARKRRGRKDSSGDPGYLGSSTTHVRTWEVFTMGKLGDVANKAKQMAKGHPDQADKGVESAERVIDERTGNKYDAQTDKAADAARRSYGSGSGSGTDQH
ncbi:Rv0909 family putative TA system antitoxin [Streptomyces sp. SGAir0957]